MSGSMSENWPIFRGLKLPSPVPGENGLRNFEGTGTQIHDRHSRSYKDDESSAGSYRSWAIPVPAASLPNTLSIGVARQDHEAGVHRRAELYRTGPFQEFDAALVARGMKRSMACLILARKIAAHFARLQERLHARPPNPAARERAAGLEQFHCRAIAMWTASSGETR
jgi:hypothetical protein